MSCRDGLQADLRASLAIRAQSLGRMVEGFNCGEFTSQAERDWPKEKAWAPFRART